jgi:hypothetical protein
MTHPSPPPSLRILPAYTGVASIEEAFQDPRAVRLLWIEILVNDRLDPTPWGDRPEVQAALTKARRWFTTYRSVIQSVLHRAPLPPDPGPVDPREYRQFAEALRFAADHD